MKNTDRDVTDHLWLYKESGDKEALEKLILGALNGEPTYTLGRLLTAHSMWLNSPLLVKECLSRFSWQISEDPREDRKLNLMPQIVVDTSPEIIEMLIQSGELNFIDALLPERKPDEQAEFAVLQLIKDIYCNASKTKFLKMIMDAVKLKLDELPPDYSVSRLADEGVFDADNRAAYKLWPLLSGADSMKRKPKVRI